MAYLTWLPDVLRDAGLNVEVEPGWETRGAGTMDPHGVIAHHTASSPKASNRSVYDLLVRGRVGPLDNPKVPGPLCHLALSRAGTFRVIAAGKANHAGAGQWRGYSRSTSMIGIEALNWGASVPFPSREPWPQPQLESYSMGCAALLRHIGAPVTMLCGHREWATPPGRKADPSGIDMDDMRRRVALLMDQEGDVTVIRAGTTGNHIKVWQRALNAALLANGIGLPALAVDGAYGPKMAEAVKAYQTSAGVSPTGTLDDYTRDLLLRYT